MNDATHPAFPAGTLFGAATAAFQIEGGSDADGRGNSNWDDFCRVPGHIADASDGRIACDHYRRWRDDVALMAQLGLQAYRFSVAWPRVLPAGRGAVNAAGLDFYERLVDELLARGIAPYVTLYHWDLPSALEGGWLARDTAQAFADYAGTVARRLGDRVHRWATLNEPRCAAFVGHLEGRHAPGLQSTSAALQAAHHLLLAHGLGIAALRAELPTAKLGVVLDVKPFEPANPARDDDIAAARRADGVFNRWFLDPVFFGRYPADAWMAFGAHVPRMAADDLATIAAPIESLGINYYTRGVVAHAPQRPHPSTQEQRVAGAHYSQMGWEDFPEGLERMLLRLHRDYAPAELYVAENGCAEDDRVSADGAVHDPQRVRYLQGHLQACARAVAAGVPLRAYLAWSLMDNFEWGHGYSKRFGLVHVDYATQRRRPKDSALAYRDFIAAHVARQR